MFLPRLSLLLFLTFFNLQAKNKLVTVVSGKTPVELDLLIEQINSAIANNKMTQDQIEKYLIHLNKIELALNKISKKSSMLIIKAHILKEVINLGNILPYKNKINSLQISSAKNKLNSSSSYGQFTKFVIHYALKDFHQLMKTGLIDKKISPRLSKKEQGIISDSKPIINYISPLIHHFLASKAEEINQYYTTFSLKIMQRLSILLPRLSLHTVPSVSQEKESLIHFVIEDQKSEDNTINPVSREDKNKQVIPPEKERINLPEIDSEKIIDQMIEEKLKNKAQSNEQEDEVDNWTPDQENNSSKNPKNNWVPK